MGKTIALPQLGKPPRLRWRGVWREIWHARWLRLALLVAAVVLVRYQTLQQRQWRADDPVGISEARELFPDAVRLADATGDGVELSAYDGEGNALGVLRRTMPAAQDVVGYRGPTEALLALNAKGEIVGMRLRRSADTPDHLRDVAQDPEFLASFEGWRLEDLAAFEDARGLEDIDIWPVSGATLTSTGTAEGVLAVAHGVTDRAPPDRSIQWRTADTLIAVWLAGGLLLGLTRLRRRTKLRTAFRVAVVVWHLSLGGGLLALTLYAGWSANGLPWRAAPGLALLVLVAFGLPWVLGRNVYCQELCPHGIAQDFLRSVPRLGNRPMPRALRCGLSWLAPGLIVVGLIAVLLDLPLTLSALEPFDVYPAWRSGSWVWGGTLIVFGVGLLVSARYPMAYCKHGCPTGWLLRSASSTRKARGPMRSDAAVALGVVLLLLVVLSGERGWWFAHPVERVPSLMTAPPSLEREVPVQPVVPGAMGGAAEDDRVAVLSGTTMRTTWTVWAILPENAGISSGTGGEAQAVGQAVVDRLAALEAELSVWRGGSVVDRLNHAPVGAWVALSPRAARTFAVARQVHTQSGGAFDAALGGAVAATGLGAPGLTASDAMHAQGGAGWELDPERLRVRRLDASCQLDLGGVLQGAAADDVAAMLIGMGIVGCLVEVGGELRAIGRAPGDGWPVVVQGLDGRERVVCLTDGAIATSGTHRTTLGQANHLIDAATGQPQRATCQAVVRAPDAATADAWATALAAAGPPAAAAPGDNAPQLTAWLSWLDREGVHRRHAIGLVPSGNIEKPQ